MNEFELIDLLTRNFTNQAHDLKMGVGDDCAIIESPERDWLISSDTFLEDVHFKLHHADEAQIGARAFNASISDIAAMGGAPRFFTVCLGIAKGFKFDRCKALYEGIRRAADAAGAILIGGDTVANPAGLMMTITTIGEIRSGKAILRSNAAPGDAIYVTGAVGEAALGLACLENGSCQDLFAPFIMRYLEPRPRLAAGQWLAETELITSMIDISDGLLADIGHLADSSGTGYEIHLSDLPQRDDFDMVSSALKLNGPTLILAGGDDYELAFTVKADKVDRFDQLLGEGKLPFDHPMTRIGRMIEDADRRLVLDRSGNPISLTRMGYDHFE